jgi:hypothetical protein
MTLECQKKANAKYFEKNKDIILEKNKQHKREKYATDAEYRAKKLEQARKQRETRKAKQQAERAVDTSITS